MRIVTILSLSLSSVCNSLNDLPPKPLEEIFFAGWGFHLAGDGDQQCYAMWLKAAMAGVGSASKHLREIFKQTFVAPDQGHCPGLSGSAKFMADFAAGMPFPGHLTPQEALYRSRAPLAVLESSIRGDTSRPPARPPAETGNLLLPIAIHDHAYAAIAMLLSLPGMDPNQLMDDKGNTWLLAAISDKDLDLAFLLIKRPGVDVRQANTAGETPIALIMALDDDLMMPAFLKAHRMQMRGSLVLELLNTYHSQGRSYSDVVKDLEQYDGDNNVAWRLCEQGLIQHCRFFQGGPLHPLQIEHLNRSFEDIYPELPGIHAAADSGHIDTVKFLLSIRHLGIDIHALVSEALTTGMLEKKRRAV